MRVGRRFTFEAAHAIPGHPRCGAVHGHTYTLEVCLEGEPDEKSRMLLDFDEIEKVVAEEVLRRVDHAYLPEAVGVCTTEELAGWIYARLQERLRRRNARLLSVRLWEGVDCWAEAP